VFPLSQNTAIALFQWLSKPNTVQIVPVEDIRPYSKASSGWLNSGRN
jgi:hypothetical protein